MYVIANEQFTQLKEIEKVTDFVYKRRQIKNELMERIESALGRKFRKAQKTTRVIDEIVWLATDRGFSFPGRETLAEKLGVSLPTVDRATRMLKDSGEVVVCYRENPNSNGPKTPVFIFRSHANFERIAAVLNLNDNEADKVENAEKPTESSVSARKTDATISLPNKHDDKYINKLIDNTHPLEKIVKYVAIKLNDVQKRNPRGITYLSAYIDKTLNDLMERAKAAKARAQQQRKTAEATSDYKPIGLVWYDFTADASASQPASQRKPTFDSDDMFAPLLNAVARIKSVEV